MNPLVQFARWFNYAFPWNQPKPWLKKKAERFVPRDRGPEMYGGIQGRIRMRLDLAVPYEREVYLNFFDIRMMQLIRSVLKPGDVFIDGGANVGLQSLAASFAVGPAGKVYAFEPQAKVIAHLEENLRLNGAANVEVVPKGLWDSPGTATLHGFGDEGAVFASLRERPERASVESQTIDLVRLDDVVTRPVKMMKLDVEGAELAAIKGGTRTLFGDHPPHMVIELNPTTSKAFGYHRMDLVDYILKQGKHRVHLLGGKRVYRMTRDEMAAFFESRSERTHNGWFEPIA
jgi:FkbM family methyltransferase